MKLKCNIPQEPPVNHLAEGIKEGLKEDRSQISDKLQKEVLFKGESKIDRLPPYLNVQMMRFFFKKDVMVKTKILKKVINCIMMKNINCVFADCISFSIGCI